MDGLWREGGGPRGDQGHMFIYSGFIGNGEASHPAGSETEREKTAWLDLQAEQKTFTSMPVLRCHTTMIKRPKQSWSYLKGFCLYTVYEKKIYDSCNKKATFTVSFYAESNKNEQVLNSLVA